MTSSGADDQTVYTRKDVAGDDLSGEPDLRKYIRLPKDLCAALTQDVDGSIFSVRQWLDSRPLIQKRFVDVMARTIARKAAPTECQICECVADETGVGASRCRSCQERNPYYKWVRVDTAVINLLLYSTNALSLTGSGCSELVLIRLVGLFLKSMFVDFGKGEKKTMLSSRVN